jgi:hypothetical protein
VFWHLERAEDAMRKQFLPHYAHYLEQLHSLKALVAGYISLPKSKELVYLMRYSLKNDDQTIALIDKISDADIAGFFLEPFQRTIVFQNHAMISHCYPPHMHPHFFYLHVGSEIGRVEIPAWLAHDEAKINILAAMIIDQTAKGHGYPISLAEAHEQAVVKGPDRDFFYSCLQKMGLEAERSIKYSQKLMKKQRIGI